MDKPVISGSLGVIPARLGSSRLARKPLHVIAGRPLIEWVWRRVNALRVVETLVVATDNEEVAEAVHRFGGSVQLTSADHPSGTDRTAEVAALPLYRDYPWIVNVQGDEPFIDASAVRAAVTLVSEDGWDVGTIACPATDDEGEDPSAVKVVRGNLGGALYFSRAPIPYDRDANSGTSTPSAQQHLRHIGLYAYSRDALLRWVQLPVGDLEKIEKLEQLRPLAAGFRIGVAVVDCQQGGVDTMRDAERAERLLLEQEQGAAAIGISELKSDSDALRCRG
jgi:3-deoxy-manno-octulosonate cytidylyltransferase (CMP-KDO synthetase)